MQATYFCEQKGHQDNPRNICCINYNCPKRGIICSHCLLHEHNDHVKQCVPLKELIKSLNKANNPKNIEDLGNSGCDILKQHKQIIIGFKNFISQLKKSIENIEFAIEQQMKKLLEDADIFVGDAFEVLLEKINQPVLNLNEIEQDLIKFMPMISIGYDGDIESLGEILRNKEVDRIMQSSVLLDREARYWMQKCGDDLNSLKNKLLSVTFETPRQIMGENRFGYFVDNWTVEGINAITFQQNQNMFEKDIWLIGFGVFEVQNMSALTSPPKLTICLSEGKIAEEKLILRQQIQLSSQIQFKNKMATIFLEKALKLNPKYQYTLSITSDQTYLAYAGVNGCVDTKDFIYFDSQIVRPISNNGTNTMIGQIPYLVYEIQSK
ncbi:hypothetical protein ABPG72_021227 [Tetrahymena utriculariae]